MSKLNKKAYRDYIIKLTILSILIIILISNLIACSLNWDNTWREELCPVNIALAPHDPMILAKLTSIIPCYTKNIKAKYKLVIQHNFSYKEAVLSGQNAAKIRPYDFYFITSLNKDEKEIIKPFKILLKNNEYTSIIKPFSKNLDRNQFTSNVEYLINQLIQTINKKPY